MSKEYETIDEALRTGLSKFVVDQIKENEITPLTMARAMLDVAGNVAAQHCGKKRTAKLLRNLAAYFDEEQPPRLN